MTLQGAIQQLYQMRSNEKLPIYYKPAIDEVIKTIVTDAQEMRHGRGERVGDVTYRCSVCGEISCCNSLFCGDCGARMDVEE